MGAESFRMHVAVYCSIRVRDNCKIRSFAPTGTVPHKTPLKVKSVSIKAKFKVRSLRPTVSRYVLASIPLWDLRPDMSECCCQKFVVLYLSSLTRGRVCGLQCNHSVVRVAQNP
jgi:hypothetical protein